MDVVDFLWNAWKFAHLNGTQCDQRSLLAIPLSGAQGFQPLLPRLACMPIFPGNAQGEQTLSGHHHIQCCLCLISADALEAAGAVLGRLCAAGGGAGAQRSCGAKPTAV